MEEIDTADGGTSNLSSRSSTRIAQEGKQKALGDITQGKGGNGHEKSWHSDRSRCNAAGAHRPL